MNEKSLKQKRYEMTAIWNSFEWLFKEQLISIDNKARAMTAEMRTMTVPSEMIDQFVPAQFCRLWKEVIEEQKQKYDDVQRKEDAGNVQYNELQIKPES